MTEILTPEIIVKNTPYFNYAFCLNRYNFLFEVKVVNLDEELENVKVEITSDQRIFEKYSTFIDKIAGGSFTLTHFDFQYELQLLKNLTEKDIDSIRITVYANNVEVITKQMRLEILPIDYFGGLQFLPQLLVSYVTPNNTKIYEIKSEAIKILERNGFTVAFEGYQEQNKERVVQMVSALYKAIQNKELIYSAMPPSFENTGQRIRLVHQVLDTQFGNCIDITLLFAACLEAIDLNPIIVITKGHAFVGVWLEDKRFDSMVNFDQAAISKRIAHGIREIAIIETTSLCKGSNIAFSKAIAEAEVQLLNESDFVLSIDIKNSRSNGVLPLPLAQHGIELKKNLLAANDITETNLDDVYELGETYGDLELTDLSNLTKQKIWERKLLDLSLRNNLLNLRFTKSMLQIVDLKINLLEDT